MTPAYGATACDTEAAPTVGGRMELHQLGRKVVCLRAVWLRPGHVVWIEGDERGNQSAGLFSALCALTGVGLQHGRCQTELQQEYKTYDQVELELTCGGHEPALGNAML